MSLWFLPCYTSYNHFLFFLMTKKNFLCDDGVLDILKSKHKTFCWGKLLLILAEVLFVALCRDL